MTMRFYRGDALRHHDLALVQVTDPEQAGPPERWSMEPQRVGVNHIAIGYPDRESWLNQLRHMKAHGVEFIVRGNHGMSHSAYIADPDGYGLEALQQPPGGGVGRRCRRRPQLLRDLRQRRPRRRTDYQRFGDDAPEPLPVEGRIATRLSGSR